MMFAFCGGRCGGPVVVAHSPRSRLKGRVCLIYTVIYLFSFGAVDAGDGTIMFASRPRELACDLLVPGRQPNRGTERSSDEGSILGGMHHHATNRQSARWPTCPLCVCLCLCGWRHFYAPLGDGTVNIGKGKLFFPFDMA